MNIYGQFKDINDNIIHVTFTADIAGADIEISETSPLKFSWDPIVITENSDNLFDEIITTSGQIDLFTEEYMGNYFFSKAPKDITCRITKDYKTGEDTYKPVILFDGYVTPASFQQPFYKPNDRFTVNVTDKLSVLQYYYYKNISSLQDYKDYLQSASMVSFKSLLDDCLGKGNYDFDESKDIDFSNLKISESEILGEEYDEVWTKEKILEQICRYLGLHIKQKGERFYLFSWRTMKNGSEYHVYGMDENRNLGNIRESDMNISIDDVYNSIMVRDVTTPIEDIVSSPLTNTNLYSPYSSSQKYMTEYIVEGEGKQAQLFLKKMLKIDTNPIMTDEDRYNDCKPHRVDWYMQVKQSENWDLYYNNINIYNNITGENQEQYMRDMKSNRFMPLLVSVGNTTDIAGTEAAPLKKPGLTDYFVISVNGNFDNRDYTNEINAMLNGNGIAKYTGFSAANLAPVSPDTTNYVIINGKIKLSPIVMQSGVLEDNYPSFNIQRQLDDVPYSQVIKPGSMDTDSYKKYAVPTDINGDGKRFLMRRFYTQQRPTQSSGNTVNDNIVMLYPCNDTKNVTRGHPYYHQLKKLGYSEGEAGQVFDYNYTREGRDNIDNMPVLACRMTIGEGNEKKWLVETYKNGKSIYKWYTEDNLPAGKNWFTIGINPEFGDKIIGQEFRITDNTNDYGIDAEGLAIQVPYGTPVSGRVEFSILGPVNLIWYREMDPTSPLGYLFYVTMKTLGIERYINVLSFISSIWVSDFSVKIYTDNGYADNKGDSDICYISEETEGGQDYVAGKYETELNIITQLTTAECNEMNVKNTVNVNSVLGQNNTPINTIKDNNIEDPKNNTAKPEELYVKEYYNYFKEPKMIVNVTLADDAELDNNHLFTVSPLDGRDFILLSKERNLRYDTTNIQLREI